MGTDPTPLGPVENSIARGSQSDPSPFALRTRYCFSEVSAVLLLHKHENKLVLSIFSLTCSYAAVNKSLTGPLFSEKEAR